MEGKNHYSSTMEGKSDCVKDPVFGTTFPVRKDIVALEKVLIIWQDLSS